MFTITQEIMQNTNLTSTDKLVYAYICKFSGQISYETIAKNIGITKMTAIRCTDQLEKEGLIRSTKNSKGWNVYEVVV